MTLSRKHAWVPIYTFTRNSSNRQLVEQIRQERWNHIVHIVRDYGHRKHLIKHIADGEPLTKELRGVLLEILTGKLKRWEGRPRQESYNFRHFIASQIEHLQKEKGVAKRTAAVMQIAQEYKVSERTVWRALEATRSVASQTRRRRKL